MTGALSLCLTSTMWGADHLARDLRGRADSDMVDVIVQYRNQPTEAHHHKIAAQGGVLTHRLDVIKSGHYRLPASFLVAIANDPEVVYLSPGRPVQGPNWVMSSLVRNVPYLPSIEVSPQ